MLPDGSASYCVVSGNENRPTAGPISARHRRLAPSRLLIRSTFFDYQRPEGSPLMLHLHAHRFRNFVAGAALLTLIGTMISDILLVMLDPRIRYEGREA